VDMEVELLPVLSRPSNTFHPAHLLTSPLPAATVQASGLIHVRTALQTPWAWEARVGVYEGPSGRRERTKAVPFTKEGRV
jgi:hypothetical protein